MAPRRRRGTSTCYNPVVARKGVLELPRRGRESHLVSTLYERPRSLRAVLLLAHGAGAGMHHPFMKRMAGELASIGVATLRYQFPYMEAGRRRPDHRTTLLATVRVAAARGRALARGVPLLAGGKSMGGRMTSLAQSEAPLPHVRGLIFFGFPLHPAGKPGTERGHHLSATDLPLLFLQGTRDALAELPRLEPVLRALPESTLHRVEGADHGFRVRKKDGRGPDEVFADMTDAVDAWIQRVVDRD